MMDEKPPAPSPEGDQSSSGAGLPLDRLLVLLAEGEIGEERGRLRWSSNYTFLISVCDESYRTLAIYKPQRGERPLWDFPDGTLCLREKAAFIVSESLGWQIVPPTVLRDGPRGLGSVQLYIDHDPEITYFNLGKGFAPQLQRIATFDHVINNADRKGGHCLLDRHGKIWGIDHGICFHVVPKLRTVIWDFAGTAIPNAIRADLENFCGQIKDQTSELRKALAALITPPEIDAMSARVDRLLLTGKFPEPGHGPNYPWPPV